MVDLVYSCYSYDLDNLYYDISAYPGYSKLKTNFITSISDGKEKKRESLCQQTCRLVNEFGWRDKI